MSRRFVQRKQNINFVVVAKKFEKTWSKRTLCLRAAFGRLAMRDAVRKGGIRTNVPSQVDRWVVYAAEVTRSTKSSRVAPKTLKP